MPQYLKCLATVPCDLSLITIPVSNYRLFSHINISQGSVATLLRCGGIFSFHFRATVCKTVRPMLSVRCPVLSVCPVCNVGVLRPNGCIDQDATRYGGRPRPRRLCIRWGPRSPPPKRAEPPKTFSAHVYCGQTAGWIKTVLDMEVGLNPGDFVLDGDPAPVPKGAEPLSPIFGPCLLWPNSWMDQDGTWRGGGPWSRPHCARWGPSYPAQKGGRAPSNFRPIFIVAKRLDASRCHLVWR